MENKTIEKVKTKLSALENLLDDISVDDLLKAAKEQDVAWRQIDSVDNMIQYHAILPLDENYKIVLGYVSFVARMGPNDSNVPFVFSVNNAVSAQVEDKNGKIIGKKRRYENVK